MMTRRYDLADFDLEGDDNMFSLSNGVGPRRRNRRHDVLKVETLFANTGDHDLEDGPTGYAGSQLDAAIRAFQKRRGLEIDGVLEPGGETIAALERELGRRLDGFRAPRPEEADDHLNRGGRGEEGLFETRPHPPVLHVIRDLPAIQSDAYQSNRRTVDALFRTSDNRGLADLLVDAIGHDGFDGVAEVRDMLDRIRDRSPARADAMSRAVFDRLSEKDQALFAGGDQPERRPIGTLRKEVTSNPGARDESALDATPSPKATTEDQLPKGDRIAQAEGEPTADVPPASRRQAAPRLTPEALEAARGVIGKHEEFRERVYGDGDNRTIEPGQPAKGNPTVGIGFNLNRVDARQQIESLGLDYDAVRSGRQPITRQQAETLRDRMIEEANRAVDQRLPEKALPRPLTVNERAALIGMIYNGGPKMLGPDIQAAIRRGDSAAAADEIQNRSNKHQVPGIQTRRNFEAEVYRGREPIPRLR